MRYQISFLALLLAAMTALAACADEPADEQPDAPAEQPEDPAEDQALEPADIAGVWGDDQADNAPYLNFSTDDDEVVGSDGCNALRGTFTLEEDTVHIDLGMSTLKACVGVDPWLRDVATVQPDGDTLEVYDHDGDSIGTLTRSES